MSDRTVARRYARSLLEEAAKAGRVEEVDADAGVLRNLLAESREFDRFLQSPILSRDKKRSVVDALVEGKVDDLTRRFLQLLVDNHRESILGSVLDAYSELRDKEEGVVEAVATLAMPMAERDTTILKTAVEGLTGRTVRLRVQYDPGLIGGLVVRVGDTVYDGSVAHQLESLRGQLQPGRALTNGTNRRDSARSIE